MDDRLLNADILSMNRHASPGVGSVNSWWIETASGIVLFDAQRQASEAAKVVSAIKSKGKPLAAILITHPHPDHVGGLAVLHDAFPKAEIAAVARTADVMRTDEGGLLALGRSFLGADFAAVIPEVTAVLPDKGKMTFAGLEVFIEDFGIGETVAATVFSMPDAGVAIVGDIVSNAMTPFLTEGHTGQWLDQLDRFAAALRPGAIAYPGHGAEAETGQLVTAQREYLTSFRNSIASHAKDGRLTEASKRSVVAETERLYPGWLPVAGIPDLIGANAEAVARELGFEVVT